MAATGSADDVDSYVRGAGPRSDLRRTSGVLLAVLAVALVACAVVLAVENHDSNARADSLRVHGVPVQATVVSCLGLASGTGITEYAYRCQARYQLAGRSYVSPLHGSSALVATGSTVAAVVDPHHPGTLVTAGARTADHSSGYLVAAICLLCAAALALPARQLLDNTKKLLP